jgi:hypothetical protein
VDIVPGRIEEARERHRESRCMFAAVFEVGDVTKVGLYKIVGHGACRRLQNL